MEIKCYRFTKEETNAYLMMQDGHGILVDPCSPRLSEIIGGIGITLDYVCLTHEHCDHLWGLNQIREIFGCPLIASEQASKAIQNPKTNRAKEHHIYMTLRFGADYARESGAPDYCCRKAEIEFTEDYRLEWRGNAIRFHRSPGHSEGSILIIPDGKILITGDTLLKGEKTFTRFEGGNAKMLEGITLPYICSFPRDTRVLPGHGEDFLLEDYPFLEGAKQFGEMSRGK